MWLYIYVCVCECVCVFVYKGLCMMLKFIKTHILLDIISL